GWTRAGVGRWGRAADVSALGAPVDREPLQVVRETLDERVEPLVLARGVRVRGGLRCVDRTPRAPWLLGRFGERQRLVGCWRLMACRVRGCERIEVELGELGL